VCSGIEAATVAWHPLGWEPQWFSEIEAFPSSVLKHHYPETPNYGDMTKFKEWSDEPIDLFVGGTPCQSFSVAGLRKGMDDPRGNLALTYLAIADKYRPRWLVWENVPGVLSSNGGRDFGSFLGAMGQLGYGFAYRVLDAQYFGVAQRRRRVFVVGYLGDWRRAAAVLFERESLSGYPAPSREARQDLAQCLTTRTGSAYDPATETLPVTVGTLCARTGRSIGAQDAMQGHMLPVAFGWQNSASQGDSVSEHVTPTLDKSKTPAVCAPLNTQLGLRGADTSNTSREGVGIGNNGDPSFTLQAAHSHAVISTSAVRRLTPRECERLQGFPDDYTLTPHRGKPAADGPRYKALGNSMAVPVMAFIGRRIQLVEEMTHGA
jgi:DNA (cytosine-5)-methyltransferase 1